MDRKQEFLLSSLIGVVLIGLIIWKIGPAKIIATISRLSPIWYLPMALLFLAMWILRGLKWNIMLQNNNINIPLTHAINLSLISELINLVIPGKIGDFARIYLLRKKNIAAALITVAADRLMDLIIVFPLLIIALNFITYTPILNIILFAAAALLIFFLTVTAIFIKTNLIENHLKGKFKKLLPFIKQSKAAFPRSINSKIMPKLIIYGIISWLFWGIALYLLFIALDVPGTLGLAIFAFLAASIAAIVPLTPGGLGVYEAAMSSVLIANGITPEVAVSIALLHHMIFYIFSLAFGGLAILWTGATLHGLEEGAKGIKKSMVKR